MTEQDNRDLERRAKRAFDESLGALDAPTRSRLTQARHRALQELKSPARPAATRWPIVASTAAVAGTVAVAAFLVLGRPPQTLDTAPPAALGDIELLTSEQELEMLREEIEFYAWLEEQLAAGSG